MDFAESGNAVVPFKKSCGVAGALKHPAGPGAQRKYVAGLNKASGNGRRIGHDPPRLPEVGPDDMGLAVAALTKFIERFKP